MKFIDENLAAILLFLVQGGFLQFIFKRFQKYSTRQQAMENAIKCLLRWRIVEQCTKSQREGGISVYELDNLNEMYEAYHKLGGNGGTDIIYQRTKILPHEVEKNV